MSKLICFFMYLSAASPLSILIICNNLDSLSRKSIINLYDAHKIQFIVLLVIFFIGIIFIFIFLNMIHFVTKNINLSESKKYIENLQLEDTNILNFFVTFLIPLLSYNMDNYPSILVNIILFIIEMIYVISNKVIYNNIWFIIFHYHIFSFENNTYDTKYIISKCSKKEIMSSDISIVPIGGTNWYTTKKL